MNCMTFLILVQIWVCFCSINVTTFSKDRKVAMQRKHEVGETRFVGNFVTRELSHAGLNHKGTTLQRFRGFLAKKFDAKVSGR